MNKVETAFRGAGHVVMAMLWGVWRVDRLSLASMSNTANGIEYVLATEAGGKAQGEGLGTRSFDANLQRLMGGPVAQAILLGGEVVYQGGTGQSDFDHIVNVIQDGIPGGSPAGAWAAIHEHEPVVQADLKRMWPVVQALAQELMARNELYDHEIRSIVRTAVNKLPENERMWAISRLRSTPPN